VFRNLILQLVGERTNLNAIPVLFSQRRRKNKRGPALAWEDPD